MPPQGDAHPGGPRRPHRCQRVAPLLPNPAKPRSWVVLGETRCPYPPQVRRFVADIGGPGKHGTKLVRERGSGQRRGCVVPQPGKEEAVVDVK